MADSNQLANNPKGSEASEPLIDWQCFAYLTADKGDLYRAIIDAFASAKSEFTLHLRPAQLRDAVNRNGFTLESTEVEAALQQLEAWGNLQSYQDNADVASLVIYYQKRLLYQLTAAGEAAHSSTLTFVQRLQQQAKLDARALERIAEGSGQLQKLAAQVREHQADIDLVIVLQVIRSLCHDADELTARAQSFFRWLHEQTESERGDLEVFLVYKERLIEYLQQFVSELITRGGEIAKRLNSISADEYATLARLTAEEEVGSPRAGEEQEHGSRIERACRRWQQRLFALRGWFSASGGRSAQLEQLRAAARAAIPRLLQLAAQMNERQSGRSDRVADLRTLAVQFLSARDDAQAHRLYRAAFALSPSRHLRIDQSTIETRDQHPVASTTGWLDAEPIEFAPSLRNTGRQPAAASNRRVVDRSKQQAAARRRLSNEAGRKDSSRETLIAIGKSKLSEIGELDSDSFRLMMELIERAVARPVRNASRIANHGVTAGRVISSDGFHIRPAHASSRDGSVRIHIEPVQMAGESGGSSSDPTAAEVSGTDTNGSINGTNQLPDALPSANPSVGTASRRLKPIARLQTSAGHVMLPDMWVEVTRGR